MKREPEQLTLIRTQRTQQHLGGIKSEIPLAEQIKGTIFEKQNEETEKTLFEEGQQS